MSALSSSLTFPLDTTLVALSYWTNFLLSVNIDSNNVKSYVVVSDDLVHGKHLSSYHSEPCLISWM